MIFCWFLPAGAANTTSVVRLMQICTTVRQHDPSLTTNLTIIYVGHRHSALYCVFLSSEVNDHIIKSTDSVSIDNNLFCLPFLAFSKMCALITGPT